MASDGDVDMTEVPEPSETSVQNKEIIMSTMLDQATTGAQTSNSDQATSGDASENLSSNSPLKKQYSEQQRLERKAYFKQLREKRKLAWARFNKNVKNKQPMRTRKTQNEVLRASKMSEMDTKMLDHYKTRLFMLKTENEELHKRLGYLIKENMQFLERA